MSFDTSTLYLFATLVAGMLGAMLMFFGRQENIPALKWWGTAYLLGAASVAIWTIGGARLGDTVSLALNAVGFIACGMVWNAARVFLGRKPNLPGLVLGAIAWIGTVVVLPPGDSAMRLTIGAAIVAIYAALTASELWNERRRTMHSRWPTIAVPVLHGAVLMLPILLGDLLRAHDETFSSSVWVTAFSIELVLYAIGTVFVIFMLVSDRAVTVHKTAASIDPLSGMFNRRGFAEACSRVIEREANAGRPVTVMIFDIDHFKSINDNYGHPAGDYVLAELSSSILGLVRVEDVFARVGGEEFSTICRGADAQQGLIVAERLRHAVESRAFLFDHKNIPVTISVGLASVPDPSIRDALEFISAADQMLYEAKRGGRNRVCAWRASTSSQSS
jgi:diguanylate cyclase (GGDEF)-like protein